MIKNQEINFLRNTIFKSFDKAIRVLNLGL